MKINIMCFKQIIGEIILISLLVFATIYANIAYAQPQPRQGPPILCGRSADIMKFQDNYKEEEFIVLQQKQNSSETYFILFRSSQTGSWTFIAYNIPNAPPDTLCMVHGGLSSYIIPDLSDIEKMLDKQDKGLDKARNLSEEKAT